MKYLIHLIDGKEFKFIPEFGDIGHYEIDSSEQGHNDISSFLKSVQVTDQVIIFNQSSRIELLQQLKAVSPFKGTLRYKSGQRKVGLIWVTNRGFRAYVLLNDGRESRVDLSKVERVEVRSRLIKKESD